MKTRSQTKNVAVADSRRERYSRYCCRRRTRLVVQNVCALPTDVLAIILALVS